MVTIEEGEEERSIVTPELRLRFSRRGDRWTHAIDIRPGPWQTLSEAVEWTSTAEDAARVVSPTYQELHVQQDGAAVVALLVGQAGPHHFSASVRVSHREYDQDRSHDYGMKYSESRAEFDVADRCRAEIQSLECNYVAHEPPILLHLGSAGDDSPPDWFHRGPRPFVVWEAAINDNDDVIISGSTDIEPATVVSIVEHVPKRFWRVRAYPDSLTKPGTRRVRYTWSHTRVMKRSSV